MKANSLLPHTRHSLSDFAQIRFDEVSFGLNSDLDMSPRFRRRRLNEPGVSTERVHRIFMARPDRWIEYSVTERRPLIANVEPSGCRVLYERKELAKPPKRRAKRSGTEHRFRNLAASLVIDGVANHPGEVRPEMALRDSFEGFDKHPERDSRSFCLRRAITADRKRSQLRRVEAEFLQPLAPFGKHQPAYASNSHSQHPFPGKGIAAEADEIAFYSHTIVFYYRFGSASPRWQGLHAGAGGGRLSELAKRRAPKARNSGRS